MKEARKVNADWVYLGVAEHLDVSTSNEVALLARHEDCSLDVGVGLLQFAVCDSVSWFGPSANVDMIVTT